MTLNQFIKKLRKGVGEDRFVIFDSLKDPDFQELAKSNIKDERISIVFSGENMDEIFCVTIIKIK